MPLEFKKVFPSDYERIVPLLEKFDSLGVQRISKKELFKVHWESGVDFCGVQVEDNGKTVAYLGLIFSKRKIKDKEKIFCNLTNLVIDESYRGQRLTHKIIQYVQSLGSFSLTAITPIPSLYSMYKANAFKDANDFRTIFWRNPFWADSGLSKLLTEEVQMKKYLSESSLSVYNDHKQFNCQMGVFKKGEQSAFVVMKGLSGQRRKFITNRAINYMDWACRKFLKTDLLSPLMNCLEVHFCDNYEFLLANMSDFVALCGKKCALSALCIRKDFCDKYPSLYAPKNNFYHSRQMFYSKDVALEDYDTLYSEVFVLDM